MEVDGSILARAIPPCQEQSCPVQCSMGWGQIQQHPVLSSSHTVLSRRTNLESSFASLAQRVFFQPVLFHRLQCIVGLVTLSGKVGMGLITALG